MTRSDCAGPEWMETVRAELLRERLLEQLIALTEPVVAAHHDWSRFSRHALRAIPDAERLERNHTWVAAQAPAVAKT